MSDTLESLRRERDAGPPNEHERTYWAHRLLLRYDAALLAAWKHDCNEWRMEGIGCAECNPTAAAIRDAWDDPVRRERDGLRSLLREAESENARLREQVAALRECLARIGEHDCHGCDAGRWARGVLRAHDVDWRVFESKEAAKEEGV